MFPLLPVWDVPLWSINLINKCSCFLFGLLTEVALLLHGETNYQVCVAFTPAPPLHDIFHQAGEPSLWSHVSLGGVTHWTTITPLPLHRGHRKFFGVVTAWFEYEAQQLLLFNLTQPSVSQDNVRVVTEWASELLGVSSTQVLWSEEMPSDHSNCYLILRGFALKQGMFTQLSLESFNNHHEI